MCFCFFLAGTLPRLPSPFLAAWVVSLDCFVSWVLAACPPACLLRSAAWFPGSLLPRPSRPGSLAGSLGRLLAALPGRLGPGPCPRLAAWALAAWSSRPGCLGLLGLALCLVCRDPIVCRSSVYQTFGFSVRPNLSLPNLSVFGQWRLASRGPKTPKNKT